MSLVIVSCAVADFVVSASLVAVTLTAAGAGKSVGAVNTPLDEMVPVDALPPGTPFTLHVTFVFVAFLTVAENVREFPRRIELLVGVMVMETS